MKEPLVVGAIHQLTSAGAMSDSDFRRVMGKVTLQHARKPKMLGKPCYRCRHFTIVKVCAECKKKSNFQRKRNAKR
jgi:hypothetical protein